MDDKSLVEVGLHGVELEATGGRLKPNSVGLPGALAISIAVISPTIGIIFISSLVISKAGGSAPLAFLFTTVAALTLGWTLAEFAKRIPSAGSFYPYITAGLGTGVGFVAGWLLLLAYGILAPANSALFGGFLAGLIKSDFGVTLPWPLLGLLIIALVAILAWLSIATSLGFELVFVAGELLIVGALVVLVVVKGGVSGQVPQAFTPSLAHGGFGAVGLSIVYVVLALEGFETCTFIAEEAKNPTRTLPRALLGSILFSGLVLAFALYAIVVGIGPSHLALASTSLTPLAPLADRFIGHWYNSLIDIAALSAVFGVNVGAMNLIYRLVFALGRSGVILPRIFGRTHPRHQTPYMAIVGVSVLAAILMLVFGWVYGAGVSGGLTVWGDLGFLAGLAVVPIYLTVAVALIVFMRRRHADEFSWWKHGLIPAVGCAIYIGPLVTSVYPFPGPPLNVFPYVTIVWILIGIGGLVWWRRTNPSKLAAAGRALAGSDIVEATE